MSASAGASVFAAVMTTATFASVPWLLAQPVTHWNPELRTKRSKRHYRLLTGVVAVLATLGIPLGFPWLYLMAIGAALIVSVKWSTYPKRKRKADELAAQGWVRIERGDNNK